MEVLQTAPVFIAIILIIYGAFLSGFTGGAIAGGGILFYVMCLTVRGVPSSLWEGIAGASGIAWCLWLGGFLDTICIPTVLVVRIVPGSIWNIHKGSI